MPRWFSFIKIHHHCKQTIVQEMSRRSNWERKKKSHKKKKDIVIQFYHSNSHGPLLTLFYLFDDRCRGYNNNFVEASDLVQSIAFFFTHSLYSVICFSMTIESDDHLWSPWEEMRCSKWSSSMREIRKWRLIIKVNLVARLFG